MKMRMLCTGMVLCAALIAVPAVYADYVSDFEDLNAAADGVVVTGQDGYYLPPAVTSTDFLAYTYSGNALGLPQNPTGGDQFIGGIGPGDGTTYARAQRDMDFGESVTWVLAYDFAATYLGSDVSADYIGSFSMRNEDAAVTHYIHLMSWIDPNDPTVYNAFYVPYDAGGTQFALPGTSPGSMWEGLEIGHWYRAWLIVDLDSNTMLEVGIIDLQSGAQETYTPTGWYLDGGSGGGTAAPANFRFFAGGGTGSANSLAFDNIAIEAGPVATESKTWGEVKSLYR